METAHSKQPLIIYIGLGYATLRIVYEAFFNLTDSTSIYYLAALAFGLFALKSWLDKTSDPQSELVPTLQTAALVIVVIALIMDAARFAMLQM